MVCELPNRPENYIGALGDVERRKNHYILFTGGPLHIKEGGRVMCQAPGDNIGESGDLERYINHDVLTRGSLRYVQEDIRLLSEHRKIPRNYKVVCSAQKDLW